MNRGRPTDKIRAVRKEVVCFLRQQGYRNHEIAEVIQLPESTISAMASELIRENKIEPGPKGPPAQPKPPKPARTRKIGWIDLKDERVQTLLRMEREKRTRQEIADALNVSRMMVYKVIAQLEGTYGPDIFNSDQRRWTAKEAAAELGVKTTVINKLCAKAEVEAQRRGVSEWLIDEQGMEQLRVHPTVTRLRECVVCGNSFPFRSSRHLVCSPACKSTYNKLFMKKKRTQEPTLENTSGWVREVLNALQDRQSPPSEEILTIKEAAERYGMEAHRIVWLRQRSILTKFDHPTKQFNGRPVASCAAGEVEIAARIYRSVNGKA